MQCSLAGPCCKNLHLLDAYGIFFVVARPGCYFAGSLPFSAKRTCRQPLAKFGVLPATCSTFRQAPPNFLHPIRVRGRQFREHGPTVSPTFTFTRSLNSESIHHTGSLPSATFRGSTFAASSKTACRALGVMAEETTRVERNNPFLCNVCRKSYSRIDHLARHYRSR